MGRVSPAAGVAGEGEGAGDRVVAKSVVGVVNLAVCNIIVSVRIREYLNKSTIGGDVIKHEMFK